MVYLKRLISLSFSLFFLHCETSSFRLYAQAFQTMQVEIGSIPTEKASINVSEVIVRVASSSSGEVSLKEVFLEYQVKSTNCSQCHESIKGCQTNFAADKTCQRTDKLCPFIETACPMILDKCSRIVLNCPDVIVLCQKDPGSCLERIRQCDARNTCDWDTSEESCSSDSPPLVKKCLAIQSIRFTEQFETCPSLSDAPSHCFLQQGEKRDLRVEIMEKNNRYVSPQNRFWREPCLHQDTAQLLFFVGFRNEKDASFSLYADGQAQQNNDGNILEPFALKCK